MILGRATIDSRDEEENEVEPELPFYKKLRFLNKDESLYSYFKSECVSNAILYELTIMMQPMKSVAIVNRGLKLAQFFISPTEL